MVTWEQWTGQKVVNACSPGGELQERRDESVDSGQVLILYLPQFILSLILILQTQKSVAVIQAAHRVCPWLISGKYKSAS